MLIESPPYITICLLIFFDYTLVQDQARQNAWPDLDLSILFAGSKLFDTLMVFLKEFSEKVDFEKNQHTTKRVKIEFQVIK